MSTKYNPSKIEQKWQKAWEKQDIFKAEDFSKRPKFYVLVEFPYPSGEGLHVGHCRSYIGLDILARKRRMQGFNVSFPMGWDAFGLPTENYAIKTGIHPALATERNTDNFKRQQKNLGLSFDWSREINTADPGYYKWTQWIFVQLFKNGLAYKTKIPISWCPGCKIGLANEEVIDGKCERCGEKVVRKEKEQWMLKITKYADRLIDDLDLVDYPEKIKAIQKDWIGRSEGLEENWQVENMDLKLKTFTTWPHTSWGSTFMVVAPEHPIIDKLVKGTKYEKKAKEFCDKVIQDKIKDPRNVEKKKEGFFIGQYVINHLTGRRMPLFIANFAVYEYGTGIVKCTPAHDQRDFEFARLYNLPVVEVIKPLKEEKELPRKAPLVVSDGRFKKAYTGEGIMINAGKFSGMKTERARKAIGDYVVKKGNGRWTVNYKLRDWVFSRQHYWGEPTPMVECGKCGWVPVPEKDLPVELPKVRDYKPNEKGESPLMQAKEWVKVACPECGGVARRETDVMPNWAGSNWYFLRYCDPQNDKELANSRLLKYWMAVDWYNGGMEHTTLHLLYSRFIYKFLWDIGAVPKSIGSEPYKKRTSHGIILGEGGIKMSKSKGNVINPDEVIKQYGADTLRIYEMFMGPFGQMIPWDTKGVKGVRRFLEKVWKLQQKTVNSKQRTENKESEGLLHKTIKKVGKDIESLKFNTAVSSLMILVNEMGKQEFVPIIHYFKFLILLSPFAPHLAEEMWGKAGFRGLCCTQKWPKYDPKLIKEEKITLVIQINGKIRDKIEIEAGISEKEAKELALSHQKVKRWIGDKKIKKVVFVKGRLLNFVIAVGPSPKTRVKD